MLAILSLQDNTKWSFQTAEMTISSDIPKGTLFAILKDIQITKEELVNILQ